VSASLDTTYKIRFVSTESQHALIRILLTQAVGQAPTLPKIWHSFASWCLELGEKVLSAADDNRISANADEQQTLSDIFDGRPVDKSVSSLIHQVPF
jgi:hypothetical protein